MPVFVHASPGVIAQRTGREEGPRYLTLDVGMRCHGLKTTHLRMPPIPRSRDASRTIAIQSNAQHEMLRTTLNASMHCCCQTANEKINHTIQPSYTCLVAQTLSKRDKQNIFRTTALQVIHLPYGCSGYMLIKSPVIPERVRVSI